MESFGTFNQFPVLLHTKRAELPPPGRFSKPSRCLRKLQSLLHFYPSDDFFPGLSVRQHKYDVRLLRVPKSQRLR